jgi:hypothetical protein
LPDDMSIESIQDREPVIIDRSAVPDAAELDEVGTEAPIGLGVQEAVVMTESVDTPVVERDTIVVVEPVNVTSSASLDEPANAPVDRGGVSGDAETTGTAVRRQNIVNESGWDRDNDANQIDVNPNPPNRSYPYADRAEDERLDAGP